MGIGRGLLLAAAIVMSISAVFDPVPPPSQGFTLSTYKAGWALFLWALFASAFIH